MSTQRNFLAPIKAALGPELSLVFMEIVNACDLNPDDPELCLAAVVATLLGALKEFRGWASGEREALDATLAKFLGGVDLKVAEAFTRAADEFQTEGHLAAREIAQSEYRAAAALRSQAIAEEVRALAAAAGDLARREAELRVERVVQAPQRPAAGFFSPLGFGVLATAFIIGWAIALFFVRPGPRHAQVARPGARAVATQATPPQRIVALATRRAQADRAGARARRDAFGSRVAASRPAPSRYPVTDDPRSNVA